MSSTLCYQSIPVTPYQQNCSVVWCDESKQAAVIDPGGEVERLYSFITSQNLTLSAVWLTHGHLDHVGGASKLAQLVGVPIIGPAKGDAFWLEALSEQAKMMGFGDAKAFTPDRWLSHGDVLPLGKLCFEVIHCPGHTPGHIVLFERGARRAFVGDVLFQNSIGRSDFPQGNHEQLVHSIRERLFPLGDDVNFVPGHGPESTFGQERQTNPFVSDSRYG